MDETFLRGIRLFNQREFFVCHEALEEIWQPAGSPRRMFLQALIHLAVGFYHSQNGNRLGARRQLRKGLRKLAAYLPSSEGIDTGRLYREARLSLEQIEAGTALTDFPVISLSEQRQSHELGSRSGPPL
jgi:predicted metal-dependent hydrolase